MSCFQNVMIEKQQHLVHQNIFRTPSLARSSLQTIQTLTLRLINGIKFSFRIAGELS